MTLGPTIITDLDTAFCKKCGYPLAQIKQTLQDNEEGTCPSCNHPWVEDLSVSISEKTGTTSFKFSSDEATQHLLDIKNSLSKIEAHLKKITDHIKRKEFKERIGG